MAEEQAPSAEENGDKKTSTLKWVIIAVLVLVVVGGAGAAVALFLVNSDSSENEVSVAELEPIKTEAIYTKVRTMNGKPMFVVTLQSDDDRSHYMQLYVEAKSRDQAVADALTLHMPRIVSELNTLFRTQDFRVLQTLDGKLALQDSATDLVRSFMQKTIGQPGVEVLLFTNMVMQ